MQKNVEKIKKYWPVLLLLLLTILFRIYKIQELFYFTYDESIPAFIGRRLILWNHIPLIGGVTPLGVHLAPYFYWLLAAILYVGKLDPISWGWAGAAVSILTTFMMYKVASDFFNRRTAFLAASFWTLSYLANVYDRHFWALWWGPLISLVVMYALFKIIKGSERFVYVLAIAIAFGISTDLSNLVFSILALIAWYVYKIKISKHTIFAILILLLSFSPIIIFDLRHNFVNTKPVFLFIHQGRNNPSFNTQRFLNNTLVFPQAFSRLVYTFGDNQIAKQYSYCRAFVRERIEVIPWYFIAFSLALVVSFVVVSWRNKNREVGAKLIGLLIIVYFIGIHIYGTVFNSDVFEHYLTGIFPSFLLIFAYFVSKLPYKLWFVVLALFTFFNLQKLILAENNMGLIYKKQAIEYTMESVKDRPFSLDSLSTCWRYSGYRYLFAVYGREPVKSYVDPNLAYLYGTTAVSKNHPKTVVSFVAHDFLPENDDFYKRYAILKSHQINSSTFGRIEVIILDNTSGWF